MRITKDIYLKGLLTLMTWSLTATLLFLYPTYKYKGVILPSDFVIKQIIHFGMMLLAYYLNAYFFIPRLLIKKKYGLFAIAIIVFIGASSYLLALTEDLLNLKEQMQHIWNKQQGKSYFDSFGFATTIMTLGISTSIALVNKLNRDSEDRLKLEKEKVATELSMLKAQIHPHFFFNTLNSIYSLSFTDAERSRKVLKKLSDIMRYLLHETSQHTTYLENEINFIRNYVEVMQQRLNTNTSIELMLPDPIVSMPIAPMILMPYVENVFKHGVSENDNNKILIHLKQDNTHIELHTINHIAPKTANPLNDATGSIGMQNTLRRLDLLYKNRYQLQYGESADSNVFELKLKITLQ